MPDNRINTEVVITGYKGPVIKLLNRAFSCVGREYVLGLNTSVEDINQRIGEVNDAMQYGFTLMDFLDTRGRMDSPCKEYVFSFIDEPEPDGSEDYYVTIARITEFGEKVSLKISSSVDECQDSYTWEDWQDWSRKISRLYNCGVNVTREHNCEGNVTAEQYEVECLENRVILSGAGISDESFVEPQTS